MKVQKIQQYFWVRDSSIVGRPRKLLGSWILEEKGLGGEKE